MTNKANPDFMAGYDKFASERQLEYLQAVRQHGDMSAAAQTFNVKRQSVNESMERLRNRASIQGFSPDHHMVHAVPDTHVAKGISTYFGPDGQVKGQWVKSSLDLNAVPEMIRAMTAVMRDEIRGQSKPIPTPPFKNEDFLVVFPLGDPHVGMYSWGAETRADFDLEIVERVMLGAIDTLVAGAPPAPTALLLNLGDYFHNNDQSNTTPRSHAQLDVDGRMQKVLQVGIRIMLYSIHKLMEKYHTVIVRNVSGNHDGGSHLALTLALDAFYHSEPRVIIDLSPAAHWYHRHGRVLIGSTHGDKGKIDVLPGLMACDKAEDWGATKFRYWYVGHVHHSQVKEMPGCIVETFRTLAASDAWHAGQGYRSGRDARAIILHKKYGEVGRYTVNIAQIEDAYRDSLVA